MKNTRGMEMAIGTVATVLIILIILVVVAGFFLGGFGDSADSFRGISGDVEQDVGGSEDEGLRKTLSDTIKSPTEGKDTTPEDPTIKDAPK